MSWLSNLFRGKPKEPEKPGQRFKIGDEVTPTYTAIHQIWLTMDADGTIRNVPCPVKFGEIYVVMGYEWCFWGPQWLIIISGVPGAQSEHSFAPVIPTSQIEELVEESLTIKETV